MLIHFEWSGLLNSAKMTLAGDHKQFILLKAQWLDWGEKIM